MKDLRVVIAIFIVMGNPKRTRRKSYDDKSEWLRNYEFAV